jgi:CDP-paratose 2-epimerase
MDAYGNGVFNAGGGLAGSLSLLETTLLCREIAGKRIDIDSKSENRPADVRIYVTDYRKLAGVRGWRPTRDARTTLSDIHQWIQSDEARLRTILLGAMA